MTNFENIAGSIAVAADAWKRGDTGPMDRECRMFLTDSQKAEVERIVRISSSPKEPVRATVLKMLSDEYRTAHAR